MSALKQYGLLLRLLRRCFSAEIRRRARLAATRWIAAADAPFAPTARRLLGWEGRLRVRLGDFPVEGAPEKAAPIHALHRAYGGYLLPRSEFRTVADAALAGPYLIVLKNGRIAPGSHIGERSVERAPGLVGIGGGRFRIDPKAGLAQLDGRIVAVGGRGDAFFHWITEMMPRLAMVAESAEARGVPLVMRPARLPFQTETLAALGLSPTFVAEDFVAAPEIVFPTHMLHAGKSRMSPEIVERAQRFARHNLGADDPPSGRRLYVSRAKARRRRLRNEEAALEVFARHGFETVHPSDMTLREQAETFQSAAAIVGPHGGALASLVFCRPGTKILELFPETHLGLSHFWVMSSLAGLDYQMLLCAAAGPKRAEVIHSDMQVNIALLERLLKAL